MTLSSTASALLAPPPLLPVAVDALLPEQCPASPVIQDVVNPPALHRLTESKGGWIAGTRLFAPLTETPSGGETRAKSLQRANLKEELSRHVTRTFVGVHEARFAANEYVPWYESVLREMGVDVILIESPSDNDREVLKEIPDFYSKPEKVVWRRGVESAEFYLASLRSAQRNKIKSALKKAEGVKLETAPLGIADFDEWYPIYEREVAGKERGRRVIEAGWARKKGSLAGYRKIFFRDSATNELIGGAIIKTQKNEGRSTIAYSAYDRRFRDRGLSIKTFMTAMEDARREGYHQISYGMDSNFYGHHLGLGLMEFRSSLGFVPAPHGTETLIKVLNPEKLRGEYFFFGRGAGTPQGKLEGHYFSDAPRNLIAPRDVSVAAHPTYSTVSTEAEGGALELVEKVETMEQADRMEGLFLDLYFPTKRHWLRIHLSDKGQTEPKNKAMAMIKLLRNGHGSVDFFCQMARMRGLLEERTSRSSINFSDLIRRDPQLIERVAAHLGDQFDIDFWKCALSELVREQFGELQSIQKAYLHEPRRMISDVLTEAEKFYGKNGFVLLLNRLHALFDLTRALNAPYIAAPRRTNRGHLTLAGVDLAKYFPEERRDEARRLLEELYKTLQSAQIWLMYDAKIHYERGVFTETVGGKFAGLILDYLDLPAGERAELVRPNNWPPYGDARSVPRILASLYAIALPIRQVLDEPVRHQFVTVMGDFYDNKDSVLELLAHSGIHPDTIEIWGRRAEDVYGEIYDRASLAQLSSIVSCALKGPYIDSGFKDLAARLRNVSKDAPTVPLASLKFDEEEIKRAEKMLCNMMLQSGKFDEFLRAICAEMDVEVPAGEMLSYHSASVAIVQQCAKRGRIPDLSQEFFSGSL